MRDIRKDLIVMTPTLNSYLELFFFEHCIANWMWNKFLRVTIRIGFRTKVAKNLVFLMEHCKIGL